MIDTHNSYFVLLVSGITLFLFGMQLASISLEKVMASRISHMMNRISQNNFLGIITGISVTTLLQSSGAVTSMLVGLGSARIITLKQVMGVIIGTAIGSTLTVQLISLDLFQYAFPIFSISFFVYFRTKKDTFKNIAQAFMGFGLLYVGIRMISQSSEHFAQNPLLTEFFVQLRENQFYSLMISVVFCAMVQSSAVTVGLAMSLVAANAINMHDAVIWVYGANIGTTSIALIAASNSNYVGKQVAWAHFFYKVLSVMIIYPLTGLLIQSLEFFEAAPNRMVANAHLVFNIASAVIFFPFINKGSQLIEKMFPRSAEDHFGLEFVSLNNYQNSTLAVSYAQREILRTADLVLSMVKDSLKLFEVNDPAMIESIKDRDNRVDFLYRETKMFLLDHANKSNTVVNQNIMNTIMFLSDIERAADAIDINIRALAIKKHALKLEFSDEGWHEIKDMHAHVVRVAALGINSFTHREMCADAIQLKRDLAKFEIHMRENHIQRLNRGLLTSINTSSIHLDLLSEYRRIASLLCNHAYNNRTEGNP